MDIIAKTCSTDCFGISGYHGSCCRVENRDWIMGPVTDAPLYLKRIQETMPWMTWEDLFIDYEEGSNLYPEKSVWQKRTNYPALRVTQTGECIFYNSQSRSCGAYEQRSEICANFMCEHLQRTTFSALEI